MAKLKEYQKKRDFRKTAEPKGEKNKGQSGHLYVFHKHDSSRLHYDFRIEMDGVLKSWAVPKGPSLNPGDKRLAVQVEDHPVEYGSFEGTIPEDEYGGGTVMIWDTGQWAPQGDDDPLQALEKGSLKFTLKGKKLKGGWTLVQMKGDAGEGGKNWLLIKEKDSHAETSDDILKSNDKSATSGRSMKEIAESDDPQWSSDKDSENKKKQKQSKSNTVDFSSLPKAKKGDPPEKLSPELCTLVKKAPESDQWLHEVKFDGYRIICSLKAGKATLLSRNGKDWTDKFQTIANAAEKIPVDEAVFDGEVVVLKKDGTTDFQLLQNYLKHKKQENLLYYIFDMPYCKGYDLTKSPLLERKEALKEVLDPALDGTIRFSDHVQGRGATVYEQSCQHGMEGIICKRTDSGYKQKRTRDWVKVKCSKRQEFVIAGYTDPSGSRVGFGALLVGYYDDNGDLIYSGKVGTGYSDETLKSLSSQLENLERKTSPFKTPPKGAEAKGVHYVMPKLVGEVEFTEWTNDGSLRHPAFQGLREDKKAEEVVKETPEGSPPVPNSKSDKSEKEATEKLTSIASKEKTNKSSDSTIEGVKLTSPDKVMYPEGEVTKRQLAEYYQQIASWILPYVANRPLSLLRCPEGHKKDCFYQKHLTDSMPDVLHGVMIQEKEGEEKQPYVAVKDVSGLIALVQMGSLEIHPWGCREDKVERPDVIVFDLDPGEGTEYELVVHGVELLRERLQELELKCFLKTTGGKGLHVVVPITRSSSWDEVKGFAHAVAKEIAAKDKSYLTNMNKAKRKGKVFVDYLRNGRGATSVAPYSTRARANTPIAVALAWDELSPDVESNHYNISNINRRLSALKEDPWKDFYDINQSITKKIKQSLGM